jgi:hypothetical protein
MTARSYECQINGYQNTDDRNHGSVIPSQISHYPIYMERSFLDKSLCLTSWRGRIASRPSEVSRTVSVVTSPVVIKCREIVSNASTVPGPPVLKPENEIELSGTYDMWLDYQNRFEGSFTGLTFPFCRQNGQKCQKAVSSIETTPATVLDICSLTPTNRVNGKR